MKIQLKRNGWLARTLGYPTNLCSFLWGITWRSVFWTGCVIVGAMALVVLVRGNAALFQMIFTDATDINHRLAAVAVPMDAVVFVISMVYIDDNWEDIRPYWEKVVSKCPQVEYVEEE